MTIETAFCKVDRGFVGATSVAHGGLKPTLQEAWMAAFIIRGIVRDA